MLEALRAVVRRIPKGKVSTYGEVARAAGFPGAARQVAWALHNARAPLAWHRVIGAGGRIRLPGASGLEQRLRLAQEGVVLEGGRVPLAQYGFDFDAQRSKKPSKKRPQRRRRMVF